MSDSYLIEDARGQRRLASEDFPLAIGGPDADVRLNGFDGEEPLAYLGLSEGDVFVQPAEGDVAAAALLTTEESEALAALGARGWTPLPETPVDEAEDAHPNGG